VTYYYRFVEHYFDTRIALIKLTFTVIKKTPHGVVLDEYGKRRFVLDNARKKYASPTEEEALASFHARKRRQIAILTHRLKGAKAALKLTRENESTYIGDFEAL
jgi:hypothetical protein